MKKNSKTADNIVDKWIEFRIAQARRQHLARELAAYRSEADRLELDAIVSRYPDDQTAEVREILARQAVSYAA